MDMQPDTCRLGLHSTLQQELVLVEEFSSLLAREFTAMTARDIDTLEAVNQDKIAVVERLTALEQERNALLKAAGYATGTQGIEPCLRWCDPQRQLAQPWERLLGLAAECRRQMRKNRQLTELCSLHTRAALHVLRGEDPGQDTYGADGEAGVQLGGRSLARA
jgi:flagellar biosynthesis/type III secretory pathway chaperone